jgi:hypothetical protein
MKRTGWMAGVALLALAVGGCASNEPEGFMPGDNLDLDGKPRPIQAAPSAPGAVTPGAAGAEYKPDAGARAPSPAEQRATLGYTPEAAGSTGS